MFKTDKRLKFFKKLKYKISYKKCIFPILTIYFAITIFLNTSYVFAHKRASWKPFINLYNKGNCKNLITQLNKLSKPESWKNEGLWIRSQILKAKCNIDLGNHKLAIIDLNKIGDFKYDDSLIYQKSRALLKSGNHKKAIIFFRKLLKHPKKNFYSQVLLEDIKREFVSDKEVQIIFPFLHETKSNQKLFLKDFVINQLYLRGAKINGVKIEPKFRLLGWQFPYDEESAILSNEKLNSDDSKNITPFIIINRIQTLSRLGLNKYIINHIPQLKKFKDKKLLKVLGETYLKALFKEKYYSLIINLYEKRTFTKKFKIPKKSQLYWVARSYIKKKNIPAGRSTIYKLEKHNSKDKRLPILFDTIAKRYMLDSENNKAQFWWKRLLKKFPKHNLIVKTVWHLAWINVQNKNFKSAIYYLNKGLKNKIYNSELKAKFLFWRGKLYQETDKIEFANKSFIELITNQPNTYYGVRLLASKNNSKKVLEAVKSRKAKQYNEPIGPVSLETKELLNRTEFLFDIAESDQAIKELFAGLGRYKNSKRNWYVSHLLNQRGAHNALLRVVANYYLPRMISLNVGESQLWEFAYPRPYWSMLKNFASQAGIDPYFALAIMREESHFDPQAKPLV